ncbi:hypothetical protein MUP65_01375 [Patescibacteria group bacterium]|nr:hypothetical protein [Patescibacteria group bacterium]
MSFSLVDLLFPRRCLSCGRLGAYFCDQHQLVKTEAPFLVCSYCAKSSVFGQTHAGCSRHLDLDGLTALFRYQGLVQRALK